MKNKNSDREQANVMLSYPIPEAESLLKSKLETANTTLSNCEEDLDFLREQVTVGGPHGWLVVVSGHVGRSLQLTHEQTMEVATARGVQLGRRST